MNCLLVIDMQEQFMTDKSPEDLERKLEVQKRMIADCRERKIPVFYTRFHDYGGILPEIKPVSESEVIFKNCSDGFFDIYTKNYDSDLREKLKPYKTLSVVGCNAEICVTLTIDSALKFGHRVRVCKNAVLSIGSHEKAIREVQWKYLLDPRVRFFKYSS